MASGSGSGRGKSIVDEYVPEMPDFCSDEFAEFTPFPDARTPNDDAETENVGHETPEVSVTVGTSRPPRKTSNIWDHFTKEQKEEDEGTNKFQINCKYCGKSYQFLGGGGYGTFRKHINEKHPDKLGVPTTQRKISSYGPGTATFHFDLNRYKEYLVRFIAVEHLSFRFAERLGLIIFLQNGVNPQAVKVGRSTVRRMLATLYKRDKKKLVDYFTHYDGGVHIGSDIWSDHWQMHSYMGITCHWIDNDWIIQKRILAFRVFDGAHTAHNIALLIGIILDEYCLKNKVFSIGFDNASANTASLPALMKACKPSFNGRFFHIRCVCHVLNLCAQAGIQVLEIFLKPIKDGLQFLWRHPKKMREWLQFCKANKMKGRRFSRDVPTRWNSTYTLLHETVDYAGLLVKFLQTNAPDIDLFESSWHVCEKILDVLEVFNNATLTLSGVYYPTTHLFMMHAINIVEACYVPSSGLVLSHQVDNDNRVILAKAMEIMRDKWVSYYMEIPVIYLVACVFDPRCKLESLYDYLSGYYNYLGVYCETDVRSKVDGVRKQVLELYNEYSRRCNVNVALSTNLAMEPQKKKNVGLGILLGKRRKDKGMMVGGGSSGELENYLNVSFEFSEADHESLDILGWWKNHANQYPILAMIAKQVLATPCSTVAVEQAFSAGGNILDESRSKMLPESLEMQSCVDDWTKAQYRQQEIDRANIVFFDDDDDEGDTTTTVNEE